MIDSNMIRLGVVSSVNPQNYTCDVYFEDQDVTITDLPISHRGTRNPDNDLPNINDLAVCIFIPPSNTDGIAIGFIYNDVDKPLNIGAGEYVKQFPDGSRISYKDGLINLIAKSKVNLTGDAEVNIKAPKITLDGDVYINKQPYKEHKHIADGKLLDGDGKPVTGMSGGIIEDQ